MAKLTFEQLRFIPIKDKDNPGKNGIKAVFLDNFYFMIPDDGLRRIGDYRAKGNMIEFISVSEESAQKKFSFLISNSMPGLHSITNNRPAVYVHKNSRIPLIGSNAFGIIDRNTSLIEIKPVTGCNLNCIYCSVDEGLSGRRCHDFVVEESYLADELRKVVEFKGEDDIEVHIGTHGEPLLYAPLADLIRGISMIEGVKKISMDTNGTLLTEKKVDELAKAGLTQFNISLNALDPKIAIKMAGSKYDVEHVKRIAAYIPKKADLILTPLLLPTVNEDEIPKIIEFAKRIGAGKNCPPVGIQNFLSYRFGRNPVKAISFDDFYDRVRKWEKEFGVKLILDEKDFGVRPTKKLPLPFRKGDVIDAEVVCDGRMPSEKIAAAQERAISVMDCHKSGKIRVKIVRSKHNIFVGKLA